MSHLTRTHFNYLAESIKKAYGKCATDGEAERISELEDDIVRLCQSSNPLFNEVIFRDACTPDYIKHLFKRSA